MILAWMPHPPDASVTTAVHDHASAIAAERAMTYWLLRLVMSTRERGLPLPPNPRLAAFERVARQPPNNDWRKLLTTGAKLKPIIHLRAECIGPLDVVVDLDRELPRRVSEFHRL